VKVCPTGIDIRNGNQMECIHCTACIDACNTVMTKLDRPINLIGFKSEAELAGKKHQFIRLRTVLYAAMLAVLIGVFAWRIATRDDIQVVVLRTPPELRAIEVTLDGKQVIRQFVKLALVNRTGDPRSATLHFPSDLGCTITLQPEVIELPPNKRIEILAIVDVPATSLPARVRETRLMVRQADGTEQGVDVELRKP
jgi:polyferredoxin